MLDREERGKVRPSAVWSAERHTTTAVDQKGSMLYHMGYVEERNVNVIDVIFQLVDQRE